MLKKRWSLFSKKDKKKKDDGSRRSKSLRLKGKEDPAEETAEAAPEAPETGRIQRCISAPTDMMKLQLEEGGITPGFRIDAEGGEKNTPHPVAGRAADAEGDDAAEEEARGDVPEPDNKVDDLEDNGAQAEDETDEGEESSGSDEGVSQDEKAAGNSNQEQNKQEWPTAKPGISYVTPDNAVVETNLPLRRKRAESLSNAMQSRPTSQVLVQRNILKATLSDDPDEQARLTAARKTLMITKMERRLSLRPTEEDLVQRHIIPAESEKEQYFQSKSILKKKLERRMSIKELHDNNIVKSEGLHWQDSLADAQEKRNSLFESLEQRVAARPTASELRERKILVVFSSHDEVGEAIGVEDYNRRAPKPWTRLTARDKISIKRELNAFKAEEMPVHDDSKQFTRFHY